MLNKLNISPDRQKLIVLVCLTVVTLAVFWQVKGYEFINFDDNIYVTENLNIQSGFTTDGLRWTFSTRYADLWNPLVWLSFMFDYQLYGLNAGGYHMTNLILHILSTLLLFWLFNRMTGALWKSAFVAAVFALHPLHVESVAWIAERKDVLSAFFWMLTLCLYVYYTEKPIIKRYLPVLLCFACALMSKPMVVTLPFIMIILDYWPLERLQLRKVATNSAHIMPVSTEEEKQKRKPKKERKINKSKKEALKGNLYPSNDRKFSETKIAEIIPLWQLWEKIPFFVLSAVVAVITLYPSNDPDISAKYIPLGLRFAHALVSFVTYLGKTFWPHDMAVFYPFLNHIPLWQILGASLLIIVISAVVIVMMKRLPYLFFGWLWYMITIVPVIGIIQLSTKEPYLIADRYHYLPSIGIAVMLAWGVPYLFSRENTRKKILFPTAIVALTILSFLTWQQCGYWKNTITLFSHALQVTKNNYLAHNNRGIAYADSGQSQLAIEDYNETIRLKPDYFRAYNNRGNAYADLGQNQLAIEDYNEAIRLKPDYFKAYKNRGHAYFILGQDQLAIEDYNEAIRLKPDYVSAYNDRGIIYGKLSQYWRAIEDFNTAIGLKQDYIDAFNNRGVTYFMQGNNDLGCRDVRKSCELGNCKLLKVVKSNGACH